MAGEEHLHRGLHVPGVDVRAADVLHRVDNHDHVRLVAEALLDVLNAVLEERAHVGDERSEVSREPVLHQLAEGGIALQVRLDARGRDLRDLDLGSREERREPLPVTLLRHVLAEVLRLGHRLAEGAGEGHQEVGHVHRRGHVQVLVHVQEDDLEPLAAEPHLEALELGALARPAEPREELDALARRVLDRRRQELDRVVLEDRGGRVEIDVALVVRLEGRVEDGLEERLEERAVFGHAPTLPPPAPPDQPGRAFGPLARSDCAASARILRLLLPPSSWSPGRSPARSATDPSTRPGPDPAHPRVGKRRVIGQGSPGRDARAPRRRRRRGLRARRCSDCRQPGMVGLGRGVRATGRRR